MTTRSLVSRLGLYTAALLISLPTAATAQEATEAGATEALPAARTVIDRFLDVTNFTATAEKTKSTHVTGTISIPLMGMEGIYDQYQAKPNRFLMEMELAGMGTQLQGFDGKVGWMVHPMMGAMIFDDIQLLQTANRAAYDSPAKPAKPYESIETVGREKFEGKECYKLQLVLHPAEGMDAEKTKKMRTSFEYYEIESGLLIGTESTRDSPQGIMPITNIFSDYRMFGERKMAALNVQRQAGMEIELTVDSVEFDTVEDDKFALPKEVQAKVGDDQD